MGLHIGDGLILGKHQRQLLLVHQDTGRDWGDDVITLGNGLLKHRDVGVLHLLNFLQVAKFELRHAAAFCVLENLDRHVVVVQHGDEVFHHLGLVVIAIAGDVDGNFSRGALGRCYRFLVTQGAR